MSNSLDNANSTGESWIGRGNNALPRGIGFWGLLAAGVAAISLSLAGMLPFSHIAGLWPESSLMGILVFALIAGMLLSYVYAVIGALVKRSGSDYILSSRVFNGSLAFACSLVFVVFCSFMSGYALALIPQSVLQVFLTAGINLLGGQSLGEVARTLSRPQTMVLIGTVCTVIAYFSMLVSQKTFFRILLAGLILGLVGWACIFLSINTAPAGSFAENWDVVMGYGNFNQVIPTATSLGMKANQAPGLLAPTGMLVGLWIFIGSLLPAHFAGELKKPEHNLLPASWTGIILVGIIILTGVTLLQQAVSPEWLSAQSYLSRAGNYSGKTMPIITFYAAILLRSLPLMSVILVAWAYTLINLAQIFIFSASRIMLAWADDGLLPRGMNYIHPRLRSPLLTMLAAAVMAQFGMVYVLLGGTGLNIPFFASLAILLPVAAATVFPFIRKDWFATSPGFVRLKIGPLPVITMAGAIALGCLVWVVISSFLPGSPFLVFGATQVLIVGVLLGGVIWYYLRRLYLQKKGICLDEALKSLPKIS